MVLNTDKNNDSRNDDDDTGEKKKKIKDLVKICDQLITGFEQCKFSSEQKIFYNLKKV